MNLTQKQRIVLLSLTNEWQTPLQIANQLSKASENLSDVQQALKDLLNKGLVQINPVFFGLYRLTTDGKTLKDVELSKSQ
ncbi:hypothetical protein [Priestia megaterium]|uniref:hypothetical protein n=1 Tax=Priestia megaterium TaxID=1404 RepID=UPI00366DE707